MAPAQPAATPEKQSAAAAPQAQVAVPVVLAEAGPGPERRDGFSISTASADSPAAANLATLANPAAAGKAIPAQAAAHGSVAASNLSKGASAPAPAASSEDRDAKVVLPAGAFKAVAAKPSQAPTRELSPVPAGDGTVIARQDNRMKKDVNADKSSPSAEQNLPGGKVSASATSTGADSGGKQAAPDMTGRKPESPAPGAKPAAAPAYESVAQVVRLESKPAAEEASAPAASAPAAQKVLSDIADQVVTFKNVGASSMDAVVRPDSATAISLQLSLHNGQVEVAARLDRGNIEGLQSHWGELQTSMAQQGVRVGALHSSSSSNNPTSSGTPSQNSGAAAGQQQQTPRRALRSPQTLDELPLVGSVTEPLKAKPSTPAATARRGWEKWA
jgi:hypothetical protein